jgi:hypothetical protein
MRPNWHLKSKKTSSYSTFKWQRIKFPVLVFELGTAPCPVGIWIWNTINSGFTVFKYCWIEFVVVQFILLYRFCGSGKVADVIGHIWMNLFFQLTFHLFKYFLGFNVTVLCSRASRLLQRYGLCVQSILSYELRVSGFFIMDARKSGLEFLVTSCLFLPFGCRKTCQDNFFVV